MKEFSQSVLESCPPLPPKSPHRQYLLHIHPHRHQRISLLASSNFSAYPEPRAETSQRSHSNQRNVSSNPLSQVVSQEVNPNDYDTASQNNSRSS